MGAAAAALLLLMLTSSTSASSAATGPFQAGKLGAVTGIKAMGEAGAASFFHLRIRAAQPRPPPPSHPAR